jgi:hypothetical protein
MPGNGAMNLKIKINAKIAAIYAAAATAIAGTGGYYYNANIDEWREEAAEQNMHETARAELAEYLPLVQQMTAAMPNAKYPPGPVGGGGMLSLPSNWSMDGSFEVAELIIGNKDSIYKNHSCDLVPYLRAVHKIATDAYVQSGVSRNDVDIDLHRTAAAAPDEAAPLCGYNGYEVTIIDDDNTINADRLLKDANDEISYLALKARFANQGAPAYVMKPEDRAKTIETAISLAENPRGTVKDNCDTLIKLREVTLDAYAAHQSSNTEESLPPVPTEKSAHTAESCATYLKMMP